MGFRLLTPGTQASAEHEPGVLVRVEPDGTAILRHERGLFLTGDGIWAGYFLEEAELVHAHALLRTLRADHARNRDPCP